MIRAITGTEDGVRRFYVEVEEPLHALEALDRLLRTDMVEPKEYDYAELCDCDKADLEWGTPDKYALKFKSRDRAEEVWLSALTTGNRDVGARGTMQALILMGFQINTERDVYNLAKGTRKIFEKRF